MTDFRKIEVTDDAGNEITEITTPIPFRVRIHLDERTLTRYRVRLIDDGGYVRGQYLGTTRKKKLDLHVPLIKLPKKTEKLRILVEESSGDAEYTNRHQVTISYLDYKREEIKSNDIVNQLLKPLNQDHKQLDDVEKELTIENVEIPLLPKLDKTINNIILPHIEIKKIKKKKKKISNPWLTKGELEYSNKRKSIIYYKNEFKEK